jgi:hypothetical protein
MHYLIAALYFLLALIGSDGWGDRTVVTRASADGTEVLYSQTRIVAGIAHFACIASVSGSCHYELFPRDCTMAPPAAPCPTDLVRQFALASGTSRDITGLPAGFRFCVSHDARPETPDCMPARNPQASAPSR